MSNNKNCRICKLEKDQSLFKKSKQYKSGFSTICKQCHNAKNRKYSNSESGIACKKEYLNTKNGKEARKKASKNYYLKVVKQKKQKDALFKLTHNLRSSLARIFKHKKFNKNNSLYNILGCTIENLKSHLENSFYSNYKRHINELDIVEIDHIIPIKTAISVEDLYKLNHYTNLQYLLRADNRKKSCKIGYNINE